MTTATIVDVTLRDGLQDEAAIVPTAAKLAIAAALAEAGIAHIEAVSFVHPKRVPQMADAEAVAAGLPRSLRPAALVMNARGFDRAVAAFDAAGLARDGYDLVYVVSASPRHSVENSGQTIAAALAGFDAVAASAHAAGCAMTGSISCAFASPWPEEPIAEETVIGIAGRFIDGGCRAITLCDTVGRAAPDDVARKSRIVASLHGEAPGLHLHDLAGSAAANVRAGLGAGVRRFEATLGGL
ncbi:MAG: hydroxymethylglutaryl-CoA lyase, partial [Rhodospirillaceae bacterium]|nr:hydroxymethylglutaryl-CoA lyase [Rhodospirillaceae bacterium]